ncbi:MAG: putative transcriptional regulator [SAR202 cluster bacterium]|nr:putative transcriptional regulator [SAR202 cluster bacterium]
MQSQNPDWDKEVEIGVQSLKEKGIVETYYDEDGEKMLRLTPKGERFAQYLDSYKNN